MGGLCNCFHAGSVNSALIVPLPSQREANAVKKLQDRAAAMRRSLVGETFSMISPGDQGLAIVYMDLMEGFGFERDNVYITHQLHIPEG